MQASGLHTVFAPCFPPAGNREKQVRKQKRMEAQPSEKMRLSQHLLFNSGTKYLIFEKSGGK